MRKTHHLKSVRVAVAGVLVLLALSSLAAAQAIQFFRIGTGSTAGTYFPIGGIVAGAISNPPGSRQCDRGGSCGVPDLISVAQSTQGSIDNVKAIQEGFLESGFSQADIAYWAYSGTEVFADRGAFDKLSAISNLFPESVHLVVRRNAGITSVRDLKGKRVSLDRDGSGTRVDALLILAAYGLGLDDIDDEGLASGQAADKLRAGEIDAFFMVAGVPATAVRQLAEESLISLVPLDGPEIEKLIENSPFFSKILIQPNAYFNVPLTRSLAVGAQWLVSTEVPEDLVYEITRSLWNDATRSLLDKGHPQGAFITLDSALEGISAPPLHPGAARFYREQGLLSDSP